MAVFGEMKMALFGFTSLPFSLSKPSDNFETIEHVSVLYEDPLKGKSHFHRQNHMTAINKRARQRNVDKVIPIKFHCRKSEETKASNMKFKSALIVMLTVFVISTLIVETECQKVRN